MRTFWVTKNIAFGPIPVLGDYDEIVREFDVVISLIEEEEYIRYGYNTEYFEAKGLKVIKLPTQDFRAPKIVPAMWLLRKLMELEERGLKVYVHCVGGLGRSGSIVAAYLSYKYGMSHEEAIKEVRRIRPGSVQAREQEKFVERIYRLVNGGNKEMLSKASGEFIKSSSKERITIASTAISTYIDIASRILVNEDPMYTDAYLKILKDFEKDTPKDRSIPRNIREITLILAEDIGLSLGDSLAYVDILMDEQVTFIFGCFRYCNKVINSIIKKYEKKLSEMLNTNVVAQVEYL